MKNYKNYFSVKGSQSLLKAFAEELETLGYTFYRSFDTDQPNLLVIYGNKGCNVVKNTYAHYEINGDKSYGDQLLHLPQDWDEALRLASEEEVIECKVGDWVITKKDSRSSQGSDVSGKPVKIRNLDSSTCTSEMDYFHIKDSYGGIWLIDIERFATEVEIEEYLIKEARSKFKKGDLFIGVRDYNTLTDKHFSRFEGKLNSKFSYDFNTDTLVTYGLDEGVCVVYEKGVWAEKREEDFRVHGYKMVYDESASTVSFGCTTFPVYLLKEVVLQKDISSIKVRDYEVSKETIKTILSKIS